MKINTIDDVKQDARLQNLNALIFLSLKQKGKGAKYNTLSFNKFCNIISYAEKNKIRYGMDSCSTNKYIKYLKEIKKDDSMLKFVEPCESSLMSTYINAKGEFYVCSFAEDDKFGLSVLECKDFLKDIWFNEQTNNFRKTLLNNKKNCPLYAI